MSTSESNHPYTEFENSPLWVVIDDTIAELEENRDLELTTARQYVIGYLCKKITEMELIST